MSKALAVVALAGVGLALAIQHQRSQKTPIPEPGEGGDSPPAGDLPPAGTGGPGGSEPEPEDQTPEPIPDPFIDHERLLELPPSIQDINLSGLEVFKYKGEGSIGDRHFKRWHIDNSLNGMGIGVFVQANNPKNYLAVLEIPPDTELGIPARLEVLKLGGETQADRDWFAVNMLDAPAGSWKANV